MPDYLTYNGLYEQIVSGNFSYFIEISFVLIVKLSNYLISGNIILMFFIYALLAIIIKSYAIIKLSNFCFYSLVVYVSNYYILQEMIQIRAGIATGFILISIIPLYNRNLTTFLLCIATAFFFHYSSLIFISLWFLKNDKYNVYFYFPLILFAYFSTYTGIDPITLFIKVLPSDIVNLKSDYFERDRADNLKINVFGIFILTRIIILFYFVYFCDLIKFRNKYFIILLKCYTLGVISYIEFARYPEIAVRLSYILMATEIIIIPSMIYTFKEKNAARLLVVTYSFFVLLFNIYFTSYFKWEQYFN
jgi:hypothetical protein